MAVQPARIARGDLRHIPVTPRIRQTRIARAAVASSPARAYPTASARPATQAVRIVAAPIPWSGIDARMRARLRPAAVILGVIIVGTMLGLVYLTQTLAAASARYEVDILLVERQALMRTLKSQEGSIAQWGSEAQIIQWAQREGLDRLGASVRVRAR